MENQIMTNEQVKEALVNINTLLGQIQVANDSVFHMADCRRALAQVINGIHVEEIEEK